MDVRRIAAVMGLAAVLVAAPVIGPSPVSAQESPAEHGEAGLHLAERTISIVVLDLRPTGGLTEEETETINEYLRGQISGLPTYRVIEQSRIRDVMEVSELQQLSGMYQINGGADRLRLTGADQVTIGSVGRLFDRIVVSIRLVELANGEIAFSYTAHAEPDAVYPILDEIVQRVREYGDLRYREITVADIRELAEKSRYAEAQGRLEMYLRQQRRNEEPLDDSPEFAALRQEINANLYEDYLKQARRYRRRDEYIEARRAITRAIALQPTSEALGERDRILLAEEEYQRDMERRERLIDLRAEEMERQESAGVYLSPFDAVRVYWGAVSPMPHRIFLARARQVAEDLEIPRSVDSWGLGYNRSFRLSANEENDGDARAIDARGLAVAGVLIDYEELDSINTLSVHATCAPYSAIAAKLANLVLTIGVDGGAMLRYGERFSGEWDLYPTIGAFAITDLMVVRSTGVHAGVRLDRAFGSEQPGLSPFFVRFFSGVSL